VDGGCLKSETAEVPFQDPVTGCGDFRSLGDRGPRSFGSVRGKSCGVAEGGQRKTGEPGRPHERFIVATRRPLADWRRREPEHSLLHATVRAHLRIILEEARARTGDGAGL